MLEVAIRGGLPPPIIVGRVLVSSHCAGEDFRRPVDRGRSGHSGARFPGATGRAVDLSPGPSPRRGGVTFVGSSCRSPSFVLPLRSSLGISSASPVRGGGGEVNEAAGPACLC